MMTVWKYTIPLEDKTVLSMPGRAEFLSARLIPGGVEVWAAVDVDSGKRNVAVHVVGTGHPAPPFGTWFATLYDGPFVWHLFVTYER